MREETLDKSTRLERLSGFSVPICSKINVANRTDFDGNEGHTAHFGLWPIAFRRLTVVVRGEADIHEHRPWPIAVENDPEETFTASRAAKFFRSIPPQRSGWSDSCLNDALRGRAAATLQHGTYLGYLIPASTRPCLSQRRSRQARRILSHAPPAWA
jgi:hypothetical protein